MPPRLRVRHAASIDTALTCNCLLPVSYPPPPSDAARDVSAEDAPLLRLLTASYELSATPCTSAGDAGSGGGGAAHVGECALYECVGTFGDAHSRCAAPPLLQRTSGLPGVFDAVAAPSSLFGVAGGGGRCALLACTDGSVRAVDTATLQPVAAPLSGLHAEMLTSCTPFCDAAPQLLCSAHTGTVFTCAVDGGGVTRQLEGHDYDAWCTATLPTSGSWSASSAQEETGGGGADVLLASGGDDGVCKLYDTRTDPSRATSRTRFDAGVTSITPVFDTRGGGGGAGTAHATPYFIVGSYDESIALLDARSMRRPVARRCGLGGGVWRTSRCLHPRWRADDTAAAAAAPMPACSWVNTHNVLVLPLMQGGAALLPYDVHAAAEVVFGGEADDPLVCLYAAADEGGVAALTEHTLIYDTAVLRPLDCTAVGETGRPAAAAAAAVVATVSFYERRVDVWTVTAGDLQC
ncbi:hypothetical protein NESM_000759900 [Novymonas esmeraldas]|uniref:Uncharacterized protein n=1 Tax=Novymonas esmeraldas TaxID=1808958 RepID=A0AAW0EV78_9TRYP